MFTLALRDSRYSMTLVLPVTQARCSAVKPSCGAGERARGRHEGTAGQLQHGLSERSHPRSTVAAVCRPRAGPPHTAPMPVTHAIPGVHRHARRQQRLDALDVAAKGGVAEELAAPLQGTRGEARGAGESGRASARRSPSVRRYQSSGGQVQDCGGVSR
jgi:hypothetical protein